MPRLEIIANSIIYRDLNPGYRCVIATNPCLTQLSKNERVRAYNRGQAYDAPGLTSHLARSSDGGLTWDEHSLIYDGTPQDYSSHGPFITRLRDRRLVAFGFRTDRTDPVRPLFNDATGGIGEVEDFLSLSEDGGRTWTSPKIHPSRKMCAAKRLVLTAAVGNKPKEMNK